MQVLIERYFMFFYAIVTPLEKRGEVGLKEIKERNILFEDMRDLYKASSFITDGILEPSVVLFYKAEEQLRDYMMTMINDIDFKYNAELASLFMKFINDSLKYDMRGTILGNINTFTGNNRTSEGAAKDIAKNRDYKLVERFDKGELKGNLMIPYILLYKLILNERDMLIVYQRLVEELKRY